MKKEFKLTTHDIQKLWMCVCFVEGIYTMSKEEQVRYLDTLSQLNEMCWAGNDYTLTITADNGNEVEEK